MTNKIAYPINDVDAKIYVDQLFASYCEAENSSITATSRRVFGYSTYYLDTEGRSGSNDRFAKRVEFIIEQFSAQWPKDAQWPEGVPTLAQLEAARSDYQQKREAQKAKPGPLARKRA